MSSTFVNVAIIGANGNLGRAILDELVTSGFNVTVVRRSGGSAPLASNSSVKEVVADFASEDSIAQALKGIDAVVCSIGTAGVASQATIIKGAISAKVKRFIPSEFGSDLTNELVRSLPVYGEKLRVQEQLETEAARGEMSYTFVFNNLYLDWGLRFGFLADIPSRKTTLYDGGDHPLSFTRLSTVAKAVPGVPKYPDQTKNRAVQVHDGLLTKRELIQALQDVTGQEGWVIEQEQSVVVQETSDKALAQGVLDEWV